MKLRSWLFAKRRGSLLFVVLFLLAAVAGLTAVNRKHGFTSHDKNFYADAAAISFARPGLVVKVQSAAIAGDGTISVNVLFTDPQGLPLDKAGIASAGAISSGSPGVVAAVFQPANNEFFAYTAHTVTAAKGGATAVQAAADSGGVWSAQGADGSYTYTLGTKAPVGYDPTALHAIGVYASRDLTAFNLGIQMADDVYYFTPSTGTAGADPLDEIKTASCQQCHGPNMAFHGTTGRSSLRMCNLCHTAQSADPNSGNTIELKVMIHKIHMGSSLPSVIAGTPYQIIGYQNSVNDFSKVVFPAPNMKCEMCHDQTTGASNATAYKTKPNRNACGACHDNVNFATGVNHGGGPQLTDGQCNTCHQAYVSDFDISILGAHVVPQESNLIGGIQWSITKISNATPGQQPTVTFTLADKNGKPLGVADFNRLALTIAGPTTDNVAFATGYVQETLSATNVSGGNGTYTYTFTTPIPANASGSFAVGLEGRRLETVLAGTTSSQSIEYGAKNPVMYFSVDGTPVVPRRTPVAIANCQTCHYRLSLHGENRVGNTEYCVFCHNPVENDSAYRPANTGPNQTIDFKFLAHRIHGGATLNAQYGTDYQIYGFGGGLNDFSGVLYPSALGDCFKCHTNGSENPTDNSVNYSAVNTPRYPLNPTPAITLACYGCHDSVVMLSHAQSQTSQLGESCSACHAAGFGYAATQVHAAVNTVDPGQAAK